VIIIVLASTLSLGRSSYAMLGFQQALSTIALPIPLIRVQHEYVNMKALVIILPVFLSAIKKLANPAPSQPYFEVL
jgi:hypothetical protein